MLVVMRCIASFPGLPHFALQFVVSITQRSGRAMKNRDALEHLPHERCQVDTRWTWSRREGPHLSNVLDFIIEFSVAWQDPIHSQYHEYSVWLVRNSLSGLLVLLVGHAPLHPPRIRNARIQPPIKTRILIVTTFKLSFLYAYVWNPVTIIENNNIMWSLWG